MFMSEDNSFIRKRTVLARTGLSKSTMYRLIQAGKFPRQEPIGPHMVGWRLAHVEKWLQNPLEYRQEE